MKPRRTNPVEYLPTRADTIAKAVCPFLIMLLVGSLAFFVEGVVYHGPHSFRLQWLIFWCVLGMVGISRIAIEKTPAYAGLYALALGLAGYTFVSRFFALPLVGWFLLAVVWWCTNKLVYDCTMIDDAADASGEGLLGVAGMDETRGETSRRESASVSKNKIPLWKRLFTNVRAKTDQPHPPGLWVVYFSIAALPVFGLGQLISSRFGSSGSVTGLVIVYFGSAFALLLLTSFLGLRRYLRQRRLKMPGTMASRWIATGAGILIVVLLISYVLPRPVVRATAGAGARLVEGKHIENEHYAGGGDEERDDLESNSKDQGGGQEKGGRGKGDPDGPTEQNRPGGDQSGEGEALDQPGGSAPGLPNPLDNGMVRWILWGLFAVAVLIFALKHRQEILEAIRQLWADLMNLFPRSPGPRKRKRAPGDAVPAADEPGPKRSFADLENPFASGDSALPPEVAVGCTFDALEVWAAELGCPRDRRMTANEFAREITGRHPDAKGEINRLVSLYSGILYADRSPTREELPPLAILWEYMRVRSLEHDGRSARPGPLL